MERPMRRPPDETAWVEEGAVRAPATVGWVGATGTCGGGTAAFEEIVIAKIAVSAVATMVALANRTAPCTGFALRGVPWFSAQSV